MSSKHEIRVKLEREYAITLSRHERAELATETIVGLKALEAADRRIIAERKMLTEKMERLSYLLRLQVDPEWTDDHIRPLHVPKRDRQGQIAKSAYRVLKAATERANPSNRLFARPRRSSPSCSGCASVIS